MKSHEAVTLFSILISTLAMSSFNSISAQPKFNIELNSGVNILQSQIKIYSAEPSSESPGLLNDLDKTSYFFIQSIGSYNFNKYISSGIGAEFNRFQNDFNIVSLFANTKFIYPVEKFRPFLNFSFGYGFITTRSPNSGGMQYTAGAGFYYNLSQYFDLILNGNYKLMYTESAEPEVRVGVPQKYPEIKNEFINLSLGLNYKL